MPGEIDPNAAAGGAAAETETDTTANPTGTARGTSTGAPLVPEKQTTAATPTRSSPAATPTRSSTAAAGMSNETLNARLARERQATEKKWAQALGYNTPEAAKEALDKLKQIELADKEKKLAEMTELERAKTELEEKKAEIARLQADHEATQTTVLVERQDRVTREIASRHVKAKALDYATFEFKRYLRSLPEERIEKMTERDLDRFFEKFTKENPEYSATAATPTTTDPKKPAAAPARRPITNGAPPVKKNPTATPDASNLQGENGKTVLPGRKNSMSAAEVRAYAAKHGVKYPGTGAPARGNPRT
jgi:hypothetical protein